MNHIKLQTLKWLIDTGRIDLEEHHNYGHTLLINAVKDNSLEMCELLLQAGANINAEDQGHWCALHHAANQGWVAITKMLLRFKPKLEIHNHWGATPLHCAIHWCHPEVAKLLIEAGADINARVNNDFIPRMEQQTPLDIYFESMKIDDSKFEDYLRKHGALSWRNLV